MSDLEAEAAAISTGLDDLFMSYGALRSESSAMFKELEIKLKEAQKCMSTTKGKLTRKEKAVNLKKKEIAKVKVPLDMLVCSTASGCLCAEKMR